MFGVGVGWAVPRAVAAAYPAGVRHPFRPGAPRLGALSGLRLVCPAPLAACVEPRQCVSSPHRVAASRSRLDGLAFRSLPDPGSPDRWRHETAFETVPVALPPALPYAFCWLCA